MKNMEDVFYFDQDDDIMTDADLHQLEMEATRKLGLSNNCPTVKTIEISNNNIVHMDLTKDVLNTAVFTNQPQRTRERQTVPCVNLPVTKQNDRTQANTSSKQLKDSEWQKLACQLEEYQSEVQQLKKTIFTQDGEVKMLRNLLDEHRHENAKKSAKIAQMTNTQNTEMSERETKSSQRESCLAKEVENLKTRLCFQEQELFKEQSNRRQSQSGSVKRKADVATTSNILNSENTFLASQMSSGKFPRLERKGEQEKLEKQKVTENTKSPEVTTNIKQTTMPTETSLKSHSLLLKSSFVNISAQKPHYLVKKLLLHTSDILNDENRASSLLTLLKYPLRHLPALLKSHSVDSNAHQSLSQFPIWQTQMHDGSDSEELDLDLGNLVSQGIFLLLGLSDLSEKNVDNLGVIHILVFLELYISSYVVERERSDDVAGPSCYTEPQSTGFHKILTTLQQLELLFYSAPALVKWVLDRTSPEILAQVIVIHDSDENSEKETKEEHTHVFEYSTVGSFRSLLLQNLQKLLEKLSDISLPVCYAALKVLIAMASCSRDTELESIFAVLHRGGSLTKLLAKDCGISTCQHVMILLAKIVPCKNIHKLLCSHTDECILLKIYQCACQEDDKDVDRNFLLQFVQFLKKVVLSNSDSIEFLLETDCQCSLEIIRCLVLVLYDKVNYLLDLDIENVISDESLSILQTGLTVLVTLCTHSSYTADHKLDVEPHYGELVYKSMMLFKNMKHSIPELEALGLQDLLDMEHIDEIEWSLGSDEDEDDESMVIDG